jgi:ATP-dependent DNA ligase
MTTMTIAPADALHALAVKGKLAQNAEAAKGAALEAPGFAMEPKIDGWRGLMHVHEHGVSMFSRSGKSYSGQLPHIEAELAAAFPAGTWLDGEAAAITEDAGIVADKWHTVQSVLTTQGGHAKADHVSYMVFDLLAHRGIDARPLKFAQRRKLLEAIFDNQAFKAVKLTPQYMPGEKMYATLVEKGYEGAVLKRLDAKYASDQRGHGWTKIKPTKSIDAIIMGFQPGNNGFAGMVGAVIFGQYDENGILVERGKASGMTMKDRTSMTKHPESWIGKVAEFAHDGVSIGESESGRFRFPRYKRRRDDKAASAVTLHDE